MITINKIKDKYNTCPLSLFGLSTDTKPTTTINDLKVVNGSEFTEIDTGKTFLFEEEGSSWKEYSGGGGGVSNALEQVSTMPTPDASLNGKIIQYIGDTNSNYVNGVIYKCQVNDNGTVTKIFDVTEDLTEEQRTIRFTNSQTIVLAHMNAGGQYGSYEANYYETEDSTAISIYELYHQQTGTYYDNGVPFELDVVAGSKIVFPIYSSTTTYYNKTYGIRYNNGAYIWKPIDGYDYRLLNTDFSNCKDIIIQYDGNSTDYKKGHFYKYSQSENIVTKELQYATGSRTYDTTYYYFTGHNSNTVTISANIIGTGTYDRCSWIVYRLTNAGSNPRISGYLRNETPSQTIELLPNEILVFNNLDTGTNHTITYSETGQLAWRELSVCDSDTKTKTVGFDESCDYVCSGVADNIVIQEAINENSGATIRIEAGDYDIRKVIYLKSNTKVVMDKKANLNLCDQVSYSLPHTTAGDSKTVTLSSEAMQFFSVGSEIGFTDGSTGYVLEGTEAHHDFVKEVNTANNTITVYENIPSGMTTVVSLNSCFRADDKFQGELSNITIEGGTIDCNSENTNVWIADMCQNGIIVGGVSNLLIKNVTVKNICFQGIHVSGEYNSETYRDDCYNIIKECYVDNSKTSGITIDSAKNLSVINCTSCNNGDNGLQLVASEKIKVCGGEYNNNGFCGVRTAHDSIRKYDVKIYGVTCSGNYYGIGIKNMSNTIVSGCLLDDNYTGAKFEEDCVGCLIESSIVSNNEIGIEDLPDGNFTNKVSSINYINNDEDTYLICAIQDDDLAKKIEDIVINKESLYEEHYHEDEDDISFEIDLDTGYLSYKILSPNPMDVPYSITATSKNLFNVSTYLENVQDWKGYFGVRLQLEPDTEYTCSTTVVYGNTLYFGQNLDNAVDSYDFKGKFTSTSDSDGYIYIWILQNRTNYDDMISGLIPIQIEKGNIATEIVPYQTVTLNGLTKQEDCVKLIGGTKVNVSFSDNDSETLDYISAKCGSVAEVLDKFGYVDIVGTLNAGQTSIVLNSDFITTESTINCYTSIFGVSPSNIVVSDGSITLTFGSQSSNMSVKVRVS